MYPISTFDPSVVASGIINTQGINKNEQIILYNASLSCLSLEFADHTKDTLPPGWVRTWTKESPLNIIKYSTLFTLPLTGQPISIVFGTVYEIGEHIQEVNAAIQYVFNANTLNALNITNVGNPLGNTLVYSNPIGHNTTLGVVNLQNNGLLSLGDGTLNQAGVQIFGGIGYDNFISGDNMSIIGIDDDHNAIVSADPVIINGTLGTVKCYMVLQGSAKYAVFWFNAYKTNGGQTLTLPTPFFGNVLFRTGELGNSTFWSGMQLMSNGIAQNCRVVTSLATTGGSWTGVTTIYGQSHGMVQNAIDSVNFNANSSGGQSTGIMILEGF